MQVERGLVAGQLAINFSGERVSNTWATCPTDGDTFGKPGLIPGTFLGRHRLGRKGRKTLWDGPAAYQLVGEVRAHQGYDGWLVGEDGTQHWVWDKGQAAKGGGGWDLWGKW